MQTLIWKVSPHPAGRGADPARPRRRGRHRRRGAGIIASRTGGAMRRCASSASASGAPASSCGLANRDGRRLCRLDDDIRAPSRPPSPISAPSTPPRCSRRARSGLTRRPVRSCAQPSAGSASTCRGRCALPSTVMMLAISGRPSPAARGGALHPVAGQRRILFAARAAMRQVFATIPAA